MCVKDAASGKPTLHNTFKSTAQCNLFSLICLSVYGCSCKLTCAPPVYYEITIILYKYLRNCSGFFGCIINRIFSKFLEISVFILIYSLFWWSAKKSVLGLLLLVVYLLWIHKLVFLLSSRDLDKLVKSGGVGWR